MASEAESQTDANDTTAANPASEASLAWILLLAFLGGIILNAMPCVLPVLALKVAAIGELARRDGRTRGLHVAAYTAGILVSLWLLALTVLGLRTMGTEVGWGFQLQEPLFATGLAAALVVFALGLFDVYSLRVGGSGVARAVDQTHGLRRAVGEGVLAVVLATPCSAPFLGTAVGFAFTTSSTLTIPLVFTAIGLGLALPFAVVALVPGARRWIPAPGPWMERLQRVLGLLLLATAIWLLWIVGQIAGASAMARALSFLLAAGAATWLIAEGFRSSSGFRRGIPIALAGALLVAVVIWMLPLAAEEEPLEGASTSEWSAERVSATLGAGRPVLVDFTADWCITCQANEELVLGSGAVQDTLAETRTELMVADWTRRDETIRAVLATHGKAGVPLYLLYRPDAPSNPEVLPELLTQAIVIAALRRADPSGDDS